jgi:hypothetical protein
MRGPEAVTGPDRGEVALIDALLCLAALFGACVAVVVLA